MYLIIIIIIIIIIIVVKVQFLGLVPTVTVVVVPKFNLYHAFTWYTASTHLLQLSKLSVFNA